MLRIINELPILIQIMTSPVRWQRRSDMWMLMARYIFLPLSPPGWRGIVVTVGRDYWALDFQGQILKKSYLRNGMADWHETKGMRVERMLDSHCDFILWPHPWPWPWIFKVKYWNCCNSGMGGSTHLEWKGCELDMMLDAQWDWPWTTVYGK